MSRTASPSVALACVALAATAAVSGNEAHQILSRLPPGKQADGLAAAVRAAGERCDQPTRPFYQGSTSKGEVIWNIQCARGAYVILIKPDAGGSSTVLGCSVLKAINAGTCFTRF